MERLIAPEISGLLSEPEYSNFILSINGKTYKYNSENELTKLIYFLCNIKEIEIGRGYPMSICGRRNEK